MAVRDIVQIGHPALRTPARRVGRAELAGADTQALIDDLIDTMRAADGAGIAANQVGVPLAVCTIEVAANRRYPYKPPIPLTVLVNPEIEYVDDETFATNEGCLSMPLRGDLRRHLRVRVTAWDREGRDVLHEPVGLTAGTFQHEIDHLNGTLVIDRVEDPTTLATWPMFARYRQQEFVRTITDFVDRVGS
jgi:peptide deformylase